MNELRYFKGIFRKGVTYDNFKSYKKNGVQPLSEKHTFGKTTWRFKALKENMLTSETLFWDIPVLIKNKVFRTKSFDKRGHIFFSYFLWHS